MKRRRLVKKQTQIFPYKVKLFGLISKNWECKLINSNTFYFKSGHYFDRINLNVYVTFGKYSQGLAKFKPKNVGIWWCDKNGVSGKHLFPEDIKALLRRFENGKY